MVVIISDYNDVSTHEVADWLSYYNIEFDIFEFNDLINTKHATINVQRKSLKASCSFWMRKHSKIKESITSALEISLLLTEMENNNCFWLNSYNDAFISKAKQLRIAKRIGLNIPNTIISGNRMDIGSFIENRKCIIKRIDLLHKNSNDSNYVWYTQIIKNVDSLPDGYFIIQEYIEKEFEIRSFYLEGKFYSMAIFSQLDEQTKIDFRKYNYDNPNRTIPIKLPKDIEKKLNSLFKELKMNSGSVDLILNKNEEYYFLEINPYGQFNMVSKPCNYYIEESISKKLSNPHEKIN